MRGLRALKNGWMRLSGRHRPATQADIRAWTVGKLLLELPRCTRRVRLLSPRAGQPSVGCEWIVLARDVEHWLEECDPPVVAARPDGVRRAFRFWLQGADDRVDAVVDLPDMFRPELRNHFGEMIPALAGELRCAQCDEVVSPLEAGQGGNTGKGSIASWTTRIQCGRGHDLFVEETYIELYFGSGKNRDAVSS